MSNSLQRVLAWPYQFFWEAQPIEIRLVLLAMTGVIIYSYFQSGAP